MVGGWRPLNVGRVSPRPAFNGFDLPATGPAAIPFPADRLLLPEPPLFTGYYRSLKSFRAFPATITEQSIATVPRPNPALAGRLA